MKKQKRERLKSAALVLLMALSLVQMGILWNLTQGFPFSFLLESIFADNGNEHVDIESIKEYYFYPETITVFSDSVNQWVLTKEDLNFQIIWDDIKHNYLPEILKTKPKRTYGAGMWEKLKDMSSIRLEFPVKYPNSMLLWFAGIKAGNPSFNGIRSIIIQPQENVNVTVNTVYVYDESSVYMYNVEIRNNMWPKSYYIGLAAEMRSRTDIMPMSAIGETFPDFADPSYEDIPVYAMDSDVTGYMQTVDVRIPESLILDPESDDIKSIQENILREQKDSFLAMRDKKENTVVFSDVENVYQLDSRGILEYKYLSNEQKSDFSDAKSAFIHAVSFIELRKNIIGDADIVLKGIEGDGNSFIFTFGYSIGGKDVYISDNKTDSYLSAPAIRINASSERVLECSWFIREFRANRDFREYSLSFINLLNEIYATNPSILKQEKFRSVSVGYHMFIDDVKQKTLNPYWMVRTDYAAYRIPVEKKGI